MHLVWRRLVHLVLQHVVCRCHLHDCCIRLLCLAWAAAPYSMRPAVHQAPAHLQAWPHACRRMQPPRAAHAGPGAP